MNLANLIHEKISPSHRDFLMQVGQLADGRGLGAVLVGGVVRDLLLERNVFDVDVMLDPPVGPVVESLAKLFIGTIVFHEAFLTYSLKCANGQKYDLVTAREEIYKAPARLPTVTAADIERDLKRRDFTINAMACWLNARSYGEILDPFDGQKDLNERLIRILHEKSFEDDPTRVFRAARFAARFSFKLEASTEKYLRLALEKNMPSLLSPVRRRHEFELILKEEAPLVALDLLENWGALRAIHKAWTILPEHREHLSKKSIDKNVSGRLRAWFRPWGKEAALRMMTDLQFEKSVKLDVFSGLS